MRSATWLGAALGLQACLLACVMLRLPDAYQRRSLLEGRPRPVSSSTPVRKEDIVDRMHILGGEDPAETEASISLRRLQLAPDPNTFLWLSVAEELGGTCGLARLFEQQARNGRPIEALRPLTSQHKVINLCFNAGSTPHVLSQAWSLVVYPELQQTPLLPWNRTLDVIIISSYAQRAAGGLLHLAQVAPATPVLAPPVHAEDAAQAAMLRSRLTNLIELPVGYTRLTPRIAAFVYEAPPVPDLDTANRNLPTPARRHYNLVLLVQARPLVNVLNGSEGLPPHRLLPLLRPYLETQRVRFVGTTGYRLGSYDAELGAELRALHRAFPQLHVIAAGDTSQAARSMLSEELGTHAGVLTRGSSLPLADSP